MDKGNKIIENLKCEGLMPFHILPGESKIKIDSKSHPDWSSTL